MYSMRSISSLLTLVAAATVFCAPVVAKAEPQPKMHEALADLEAARAKLEHAEHDKGGHREKALELVNQAIAQIKEGIRFDNRH
jgi:hypothetical protein